MKSKLAILAILIVQILCAGFFVFDIGVTMLGLPIVPINWTFYELIEISAAVGLICGVILGAVALRWSMVQSAHAKSQLRAASGAFMELLQDRFAEWELTPAERDVALFSIKGLSTQEIAQMRQTSEGTVKAQTNAIYRKAKVSGRPQLLSLFIEDLMDGPLT